jgi:hypothetical protein
MRQRWHQLLGLVPARTNAQSGSPSCQSARAAQDLLRGRLSTNNFVPLDDRGNTDSSGAIFRLLIDPNHFAHGANENLGTSGDFGRQSQRDVELRSRSHVLVNCEVNAARGNVASLPTARGDLFFKWHTNNDRQRQVISTCSSTLRHLLPPDHPFVLTCAIP